MDARGLRAGERYVVRAVGGGGRERLRLLELGLLPGTVITVYNVAPLKTTVLLGLRGYMLALRQSALGYLTADKVV